MAKKKPNKRPAKTVDLHDLLEDLVALAQESGLPGDAFHGDLEDACEMDMELALEDIQGSELLQQLEFLYLRGWHISRLREMIQEYAQNKENRP